MVASDKIEYAMYETFIKKHPDWIPGIDITLTSFINNNMTYNNIEAPRFFSNGLPRETMSYASVYDMYIYIAESIVKMYNSVINYANENEYTYMINPNGELEIPKLYIQFPYYKELIEVVTKFVNCSNISLLLQTNPDILKLCTSMIQSNYELSINQDKQIIINEGKRVREMDAVTFANMFGNGPTRLPLENNQIDLFRKINNDFGRLKNVTNIDVNSSALNKCAIDLINGTQLKNSRNEYEISGKLYATQDIGLYRNSQQDSVLLFEHPQNKEFRIMIVADGMGGSGDGSLSSGEITKYFAEWFKNLDAKLANNPSYVSYLLNEEIQKISKIIYDKYNKYIPAGAQPNTGATFTGAVICSDYTIIAHVGDSRAYTIKKNKLTLQTMDESAPWHLGGYLESGQMPSEETIDKLKFQKNNNAILRFIGQEKVGAPQIKIIPNKSYDRLLIMSDGVSDLLTQEQIRVISKSCPKELVTKELVKKSLQYNAENTHFMNPEEEVPYIRAGKDNATAAMYSRR